MCIVLPNGIPIIRWVQRFSHSAWTLPTSLLIRNWLTLCTVYVFYVFMMARYEECAVYDSIRHSTSTWCGDASLISCASAANECDKLPVRTSSCHSVLTHDVARSVLCDIVRLAVRLSRQIALSASTRIGKITRRKRRSFATYRPRIVCTRNPIFRSASTRQRLGV